MLTGCGGGASGNGGARDSAADGTADAGGGSLAVDGSEDGGVVDPAADVGPLSRVLASFDPFDDASPGLEGFALSSDDDDPGNLAVSVDGGASATLSWTATDGDPALGALVSDAPFDGYDELIDVQKSFGTSFPQDWTAKTTLHAWVKIASGLNADPHFPAKIQLYAQSFSGITDAGPSSTCPPAPAKCYVPASHPSDGGVVTYATCSSVTDAPAGNGWNEYRVDLATCPPPFALDTVVAFGVIVQSGAAPGSTTDADASPTAADGSDASIEAGAIGRPTNAVIYFDTFSVD